MALILNNEEVARALDARGYVDAMEEAFTELGKRTAIFSPRTETSIPLIKYGANRAIRAQARRRLLRLPQNADRRHSPAAIRAAKRSDELIYRLKTMPGGYPKCGVMALRIDSTTDTHPYVDGVKRGVKVPLGPGWRYTGIVILFSIETGEVLAIMPDGQIQAMRVGATSAVAVKHLSRRDAKTIGLIGSGWQAASLLETVSQVRRLRNVRVFSPNPKHRRDFGRQMERRIGVEVVPVDSAQKAFKGSDIVLCATSSWTPTFRAKWLEEGMHLGTLNTKETDLSAFRRCDSVVVNIRPFSGTRFINDFVMGGSRVDTVGKGTNRTARLIDWDRVTEMGQLLAAKIGRRKRAADVTFHANNIGVGIQFAAAGARILENARRRGLGREVPTDWFLQKEHT